MLKSCYSHFLSVNPHRLHFAAHSHHLWPDCTRDAQIRYWDDSARLVDDKWWLIFDEIIPAAQHHIANLLNINHPERIAFAPNTHEFIVRILSTYPPAKKLRILTTDGEFHSFARQIRRLEQDQIVDVTKIPVAPFDSFEERICRSFAREDFDLVFFSQVFFVSGFAPREFRKIAELAVTKAPVVVIDGYHGFMAIPTDLSLISDKVFYLAGGYKYAQSGEGACFLVVPPTCSLEPRLTGWFASFESLEDSHPSDRIKYGEGYFRFLGSTFDPSGLYRFNAVMDLLVAQGITVELIHKHVQELQQRFLDRLNRQPLPWLTASQVIAIDGKTVPDPHAHFLTFKVDNASNRVFELRQKQIIVDNRGEYLRFGFGLYHDASDIDALFDRLIG